MNGPEAAKRASSVRVVLLEQSPGDLASLRELLESCSDPTLEIEDRSWGDREDGHDGVRGAGAVLFDVERLDAQELRSEIDSIRCASPAAILALVTAHGCDRLSQVLEAGADALLVLPELTSEHVLNTITTAIHSRRTIQRMELEVDCAVHMADHDRITNLENRHSLERRLSPLLANATRNDRKLGVLLVEVGGLKSVNDSLGHHAGNQLLRNVAGRLVRSVRWSDKVTRSRDGGGDATISHLGGNEFTVVLAEIATPQDAARVAQRIIDVQSAPLLLDGQEVFVRTRVGIAVFPFDGSNVDVLLRNAGSAKLQATKAGGNAFRFYAKSMNSEAARRLKLGSLLHRALEREEFSLHYQPLRDADRGRLLGVEALLRWATEELGDVSPEEFIPIAEDNNLIVPIGEWVLRTAFAQHCSWLDAGYQPIRLNVNLSGRQLECVELAEMVARALRETGMSSAHLELEITETTIMSDDGQAKLVLEELRDMGIGLALDDFGTGFSTLTHLCNFPVNRLKIDRSFISQIQDRSAGADVASAVIAMAHSLDLATVAEGVETVEQVAFLREHGCDELQGFLLGRPVPAPDFERFLERAKRHG